jgi:hypothetical protein
MGWPNGDHKYISEGLLAYENGGSEFNTFRQLVALKGALNAHRAYGSL